MAKTKTKRAAKTKSKKKTAKRKAGKKKAGKKRVSRTKPPAPQTVAPVKTEIDFDDEDAVLREVADRIEIPADDLEIEDVSSRTFTGVTAYEVRISYAKHGKSWMVYQDDDDAEAEALASVKQDLEEDPSMFNQDFIESHINMSRLRDVVYQSEMENDSVEDMVRYAPDRFWEDYERAGFDIEEYETIDEDGDKVLPDEVPDDAIETLKEHYATDRAKDPMEYFRDIYGDKAAKHAIEAAGIDIDAAAQEAVNVDGWIHFLNSYDGDYILTTNDIVVFRTN